MNQLTKIEPAPLELRSLLVNPYGRRTYRFEVGLAKRDLMDRLRGDTAQGFEQFDRRSEKPLAGKVDEDEFAVRVFSKMTKNDWAPVAYGRVVPTSDKRVAVSVEFGLKSHTATFLRLGLPIALMISLAMAASGERALLMVMTPITILVLVLSYVCAKIGQKDQRTLLHYFHSLPESNFQNTKLIE